MKNNMIIRRIFTSLIFAGLFLISGCKKALDINQDPNNPSISQGTPRLLFPSAVLATAAKVGGDLAIIGGIWGEYVTESVLGAQYQNIDAYNVLNTDLTNNSVYDVLFTTGLKNYQSVINSASASQDWNYFLMGTVMKAYTTEILVDLYDKIPYFEALQGNGNLNPKSDDGYSIYVDLLKSLDTALSKNFSGSTNTSPGNTDLVFGGDMNKWKQFANTLELKMYLRMVNAKPSEAQAGIQKLYSRGATFLTSDAGVFGFKDVPNEDNPLYEQNIRSLNTSSNLRASTTFASFLISNNDSRSLSYFGTANPSSINQGDYSGNNPVYRSAAVFVESPTDPVIFLSAAESYFLQAEARERYYAGDVSKGLYNSGVLASFAAVGEDGTSYISPGGPYVYPSAGTLDQKIEAISTQKWASFPYGVHFIEGFFEKQRTGYPRTSVVYSTSPSYVPGQFVVSKNSVLGGTSLPRRLPFASHLLQRNSNAPSPVPITTPVWWAK